MIIFPVTLDMSCQGKISSHTCIYSQRYRPSYFHKIYKCIMLSFLQKGMAAGISKAIARGKQIIVAVLFSSQ